jgi:hypothetical protein
MTVGVRICRSQERCNKKRIRDKNQRPPGTGLRLYDIRIIKESIYLYTQNAPRNLFQDHESISKSITTHHVHIKLLIVPTSGM